MKGAVRAPDDFIGRVLAVTPEIEVAAGILPICLLAEETREQRA
jgi:hypothetical protein